MCIYLIYVPGRACDVRALGPAHLIIKGECFTYVYDLNDLLVIYALCYVFMLIVITVIVRRNNIMIFHVLHVMLLVY